MNNMILKKTVQTMMRQPAALRQGLVQSNIALSQSSLVMNATRSFSSNFQMIEQGSAKLSKALDKEIQYENENYAAIDDIENFLDNSGFDFHEEDHKMEMRLTKTVGDKKVEVTFEARQPMPDDEQPEDPEQQEGQEEDMQQPDHYADFSVVITDASGKSGLVIECTTMDTELGINTVQQFDDVSEVKKVHRYERSMRMYQGPEFTTLDERIQTAITQYLEGYGINEHLCSFVEIMSLDKDQRLYMAWLSKMKDFIQE